MEKDVNNADTPAGEDEIRKTDKDSGQQTTANGQQSSEESSDKVKEGKKRKSSKHPRLILIAICVIVCAAAILILYSCVSNRPKKAEIEVETSLKRIVNASDLSTYEAIYNSVAEVKNPEDKDKTDYYVSYNGTVKAGFDFEEITVDADSSKKTIIITIPEIKITDTVVDETSLDYIFVNSKANKSGVSAEALKACLADIKKQSTTAGANGKSIYDLAAENAKNTVKALVTPFIDGLDDDYKLTIKVKGE